MWFCTVGVLRFSQKNAKNNQKEFAIFYKICAKALAKAESLCYNQTVIC